MRRVCIILIYMALLALSLTVSLWGNDFPIAYNADEPGKVLQVTGQFERNHRHPPLLLDASWFVCKITGTGNAMPDVVARGRLVSALAGATSALLLAGLAHWISGSLAAILVGLMVGLCPSLTVFAHYMKEDTLLVMGMCCVLVTATVYRVNRHWWSAALLGAACVVAVMTKYIGIVALLPALIALIGGIRQIKSSDRWLHLLAFVLALGVTLALLGYHWWADMDAAIKGVTYEWQHVREGHFDLKSSTLDCLRYYLAELPWEIAYWPILPAIAGVIGLIRSREIRCRTAGLCVLVLGGVYGVLLILGHVKADRYVLPVVVMVSWFAAMGLAIWICRLPNRKARRRWGIAACLIVAGCYGYHSYRVMYQFTHDGRPAMWQWVRANLDASDILVEDMYCGMPDARYPIQVKLYGKWEPQIHMKRYAADFGSLDQLRKGGVRYVAVCNYSYDRFMQLPQSSVQQDARDDQHVAQYRAFYSELFKSSPPVWQHRPCYRLPGLTSPRLAIYRIDSKPQDTTDHSANTQ